MWRLILATVVVLVLPAESHSSGADDRRPPPEGRARKLIEFGWDEPDTAFLRRHLAEMEASPFDGCVFHVQAGDPTSRPENFAWLCWGRRAFTEAELAPALDDLRALAPRTFTSNFLRFNTAPADLDWFDDHSSVLSNARLAARLAREGRCAGILLDVEEYQGKLFTYGEQREAKSRSWDAYAAQARRRGREVMGAFREGFPGLTVLLTFGHSLPRSKSAGGRTALADCRYGLLAPFLDGMVDAAEGGARLVDGFELSYGYREEAKFEEGYRHMTRDVLPIVADPAKFARVVSAGFGLWMDYDWTRTGWDTVDLSRNYFTPDSFESSLRWALGRSDEYVWIYTETPRWWSAQVGRVKLPDPYDSAIRKVRMGMKADK